MFSGGGAQKSIGAVKVENPVFLSSSCQIPIDKLPKCLLGIREVNGGSCEDALLAFTGCMSEAGSR